MSAPGGRLLSSEATWEDDAFHFPLRRGEEPEEPGEEAATFDFDGAVRFHGHFGMLVAELADLRVARGDDGWKLSFADGEDRVDGFVLDGEPVRSGNSPRTLSWDAVRLTEAGSEIFGGHYPPGTLFDPLTISL
jgi:hypothetical protein